MYSSKGNSSINVLVIFNAIGGGGGSKRALQSIKYYGRLRFRLYVHVDALNYLWALQKSPQELVNVYRMYRLEPVSISRPIPPIPTEILGALPSFRRELYVSMVQRISMPRGMLRIQFLNRDVKPDIIIAFHEDLAMVKEALMLRKMLGAPTVVFLQSPPFIGIKERLRQIIEAFKMHLYIYEKVLPSSSYLVKYIDLKRRVRKLIEESENPKLDKLRTFYERLDLLIAVSRAIPYEMGWIPRNLYIMDPGVALDDEELSLMLKLKLQAKDRDNYIVFSGRPMDPVKGVVEAILAFKYLFKDYPDLKLYIVGFVTEQFRELLYKFVNSIGVESDKVRITGYVPREENFKIIAKARLLLYPSHLDAFSYTVLESLILGTPVVAYEIPALSTYYSHTNGVFLARESDVGELVEKSIAVLESAKRKDIDVRIPQLRSWSDILSEEVEVLRRLLKV